MLTDFAPDCEKCFEEVGTHPTKYRVCLPEASAIRLGMTATYSVECDECGGVTGGYLEVDEADYLLAQMCDIIGFFGAPNSSDRIPDDLTAITKLELMKSGLLLARLNPRRTSALVRELGSY
jgi:hypothetical protein